VERKESLARRTHRTRRDEAGQEASYPETIFAGCCHARQEALYPETSASRLSAAANRRHNACQEASYPET
jgi:hypothetical protein